MKKQRTFLKEENLLTLFSQNNFIIPEIQREYVWGHNEKVITKFLRELKGKIGEICSQCRVPDSNDKINIGFLYTYKPDYVKVQNERFLDENLIDGQQRITTLFLLLFYFGLREGRKNDFLSLLRYDGLSMSFNFKVRDLTRRFLLDLVENIISVDQLSKIEQQTWYLQDYESDVSISGMIKSLKIIQNEFPDNAKYYNHFINNIVFWHFKTEVTSEGEELYITMNARGEDLSDNEITKAALMIDGKDLLESGKQWEEWQHFFWKNRNKSREVQSADFGFNSFIKCIGGLENFLRIQDSSFGIKDINELLTIPVIDKYMLSFQYLISHRDSFKEKYSYSQWIDRCFEEIWEILNKDETDWLVDFTDQNKGKEQNQMVFIWSWLLFLSEKIEENRTIDEDESFRFLRFFYIRYKNNSRAVSTLRKTVSLMDVNGVMDTTDQLVSTTNSEVPEAEAYKTYNEKVKYKYLSKLKMDIDDNSFRKAESILWQIEDHPFNLVGADLKNVNSSHLIDFSAAPDLEELERINQKFYQLFPSDGIKVEYNNADELRNILLFYGEYWQKKWASYYWKYDFGEWNRIVRDHNKSIKIFKLFFEDYKLKSLQEILLEKVKNFEPDPSTEIEAHVFKSYAVELGTSMWSQGRYIAIGHYNHPGKDKLFSNFKELVNIKGNFNGGNPQVLSQLIPVKVAG